MGLNNEKKLVISNGTWEMAKENKWLNKKVVCIIALVIISLSLWFLWPSSEKIDADFVVYIEGNGSPITFKIEPEYIKVAKDQEIQLEVIGYFVSNSMIPGRKPYIIEPQDVVVVELPDKKLYRMSDRVVWHTNADNGYMKFSIHYDANFATAIKKDNGRFIDGAVKIAIKFNPDTVVGSGKLVPLTETNSSLSEMLPPDEVIKSATEVGEVVVTKVKSWLKPFSDGWSRTGLDLLDTTGFELDENYNLVTSPASNNTPMPTPTTK